MTLAIVFDSVGAGEWLVLLAVLLVVVGPRRLPAAARQFGSYYSKFRRAAENFRRQLMEMDAELEREVSSMAGDPPKGFIPEDNAAPAPESVSPEAEQSVLKAEGETYSANAPLESSTSEPESSDAD